MFTTWKVKSLKEKLRKFSSSRPAVWRMSFGSYEPSIQCTFFKESIRGWSDIYEQRWDLPHQAKKNSCYKHTKIRNMGAWFIHRLDLMTGRIERKLMRIATYLGVTPNQIKRMHNKVKRQARRESDIPSILEGKIETRKNKTSSIRKWVTRKKWAYRF